MVQPTPSEFDATPYRAPPWVRACRAIFVGLGLVILTLIAAANELRIAGMVLGFAGFLGFGASFWIKWLASCPSCTRKYNAEARTSPVLADTPSAEKNDLRGRYHVAVRPDRQACPVCGYRWNEHRRHEIASRPRSIFTLPEFLDRHYFWTIMLSAYVLSFLVVAPGMGAFTYWLAGLPFVLLYTWLTDKALKKTDGANARH